MRCLSALVVLLLGLTAASTAAAAIRLISVTSPVRAGGSVTLIVRATTTSPCSIRVHFGSRRPIIDAGLYPRAPLFSVLHWTWKMPARAARGRWSVDVSCGAVGSLRTSLVVR